MRSRVNFHAKLVRFLSTCESHSNTYYVIVNKLTLQMLTVIQRSRFSVSVFFFFFFFFYELKLMYICLFTRAKSGREMTDCILSLPLMTVSDKHLYNISSKKGEKILQSLR